MRITGVTFAARKVRRAKYIVIPVIVLLFILLLATVILSVYKSWNLLHPEKKPIDAFSSNIVPEYRDITFRGADSTILLDGWLFEAKHSDRAVILVHSYGSNRLEFGVETVDMIKEFLNNGYNVLAFDLRNSGESGGKDCTFGYNEKEDVKAAIKYMRNQGSKRITLMGFSTGASAAILAAAESTSSEGSALVDAVIADSPYSDLKSYFISDLDKWTDLPQFPFNRTTALAINVAGGIRPEDASPVNAITAENTPHLMLIHSRNDDFIPIINSIELYQKYSGLNPSGAEFWQTGDQGHVQAYMSNKQEYLSRVFSFLRKVYPED
ncbi:MAG: alpha/beta fold hydrolase [Clostridiaceae bacterium]|jgi:dipeptidyl aminopeptidase/acylaminoacyl peptidase|nr:alpha/beta fold hydrolase [Clostridiaceae bacterium]